MNKKEKVLALFCCLIFVLTSFSLSVVSEKNIKMNVVNEKDTIIVDDTFFSDFYSSVSSNIFSTDSSCDCLVPNSNLPFASFPIKPDQITSSISESNIFEKKQIIGDSEKSHFSIPTDLPFISFTVEEQFSENTLVFFEVVDQFGSMSLSCSGYLFSTESYVRFIVYDALGTVYLVFSTDSFGLSKGSFSVENIALETISIDSFKPMFLIVEISDAIVTLDTLYGVIYDYHFFENKVPLRDEILMFQQNALVRIWNDLIKEKGMLWSAGSTDVSRLSFAQKTGLLGGTVPNLFGFEYYTGGIFSSEGPFDYNERGLPPEFCSIPFFNKLVDEWDWRNRHDATHIDSHYFDGDIELATGWSTPAKHQYACYINGAINPNIQSGTQCVNLGGEWRDCGSCWAFATVAVTETLINLYYNSHLDYDLSEQQLVTESTYGCSGMPGWAPNTWFDFISNNGIIEEYYFPYTANNSGGQNTWNPLTDPLIKGSGTIKSSGAGSYNLNLENELKKLIIENGPLWAAWLNHAIVCYGYATIREGMNIIENPYDQVFIEPGHPWIGKPYWIMKNSFGANWGYQNNGFFFLKLNEEKMKKFLETAQTLADPIEITINESPIHTVLVRDDDGDGYYNWGVGPKPEGYDHIPDEPDGNDNNYYLGPLNEMGHCTFIRGKNIMIHHDERIVLGLGTYDLGSFSYGEHEIFTFSIENPGDEPLILTGTPYIKVIDDKWGVFEVIEQPTSSVIQPGDTVTFKVRLSTSYGGISKAIIFIQNNDPISDDYYFNLIAHVDEVYNYNTATWYTTIQQGINSASEGDILIVPKGEFFPNEQITLNKEILLRSHTGAKNTIINGEKLSNAPRRCFFIDNHDAIISGFTIRNGDLLYDYSVVPGHLFGGGIYLNKGVIDSCIIEKNNALYGGAIYIQNTGEGVIKRTIIRNNNAQVGGGIYVSSGSEVTIENCLLHNNYAGAYGGGVYIDFNGLKTKIDLTTIVYNKAGSTSGGIYFAGYLNPPTLTNSIIYFNEAISNPQLSNWGGYSWINNPSFSYCCTSPLPMGIGNIDEDPLFNQIGNYIFSLSKSSPCINAGNPNDVLLPKIDLAGRPRLCFGRVDMGAYEYQRSPSINISKNNNISVED
jgi:hypothetical protein